MGKGKKAGRLVFGFVLALVLTVLCITEQITRTTISKTGVAYEQKVDSVAFGYQLKQDFVSQYERLDTIEIYIDSSGCARDLGALECTVLNENGKQIFFTEIPVSELPRNGWVEVPVRLRLLPGQVNTLILESVGCVDNGPSISFVDSRLAAVPEQQGFHLVYAGMDVEHSALKAAFCYTIPIELYEYFAYYIFGLMLIALVFCPARN